MSKQQKGRKHRTPQHRDPRPTATAGALPRQARRPGGPLPIRGNQDLVAALMEHAPPHQLVELLMPNLWAMFADGIRANVCVDACLTLKYALGQFGIRSHLQAVMLTVRTDRQRELYGTTTPTWSGDGTIFNGHCILVLPDSGRFLDPTIEQFKEIATLGQGPLVGKTISTTHPLQPGERMTPGTQLGLQRGNLVIVYTVAEHEHTDAIETQPWVVQLADQHLRTGVNLASMTLEALRGELVVERARQAPYPRLTALLDAVGDAPAEPDEARDFRFHLPGPDGTGRRLRLDEVPLPEGTPAALPL